MYEEMYIYVGTKLERCKKKVRTFFTLCGNEGNYLTSLLNKGPDYLAYEFSKLIKIIVRKYEKEYDKSVG